MTDDQAEFLNVAGDWIYYSNASDENKLYKIKTDGTNKTKISDETALFIQVAGDWVYYANNSSEQIIKVKTDGSERQIMD